MRAPTSLQVPLEILRCPASGQPLRLSGDTLESEDGTRSYPVVKGAAVLIDESRSLFTNEQVAGSAGPMREGLLRRAARLLPSETLSVGAEGRFKAFLELAKAGASGDRARILLVGAGAGGRGSDVLAADGALNIVQTDVYLGPNVDVACDGQHLPFADGAFDGVVVEAMLQLVEDPRQVVAEVHRVLRPGGAVFADTGFVQQVCEGAYDFTRFTELGHRLLFRMFTEVDRGVSVGPATALLWSLRYFAASLPKRSRIAARLLEKATTLAFFWLKHLDRVLISHRGAHDAASAVYFIGTKADSPVSTRDVLATYRGTLAPVAQARGLED